MSRLTDLDGNFSGCEYAGRAFDRVYQNDVRHAFFYARPLESRLIWLTALAGFFWLAIMFAYTMQDYLTRSPGVFGR